MNVKMIGSKVLLKEVETKQTGVVIFNSQPEYITCEVVQAGPDTKAVKVGDTVLVHRNVPKIELSIKESYRLINEPDIVWINNA